MHLVGQMSDPASSLQKDNFYSPYPVSSPHDTSPASHSTLAASSTSSTPLYVPTTHVSPPGSALLPHSAMSSFNSSPPYPSPLTHDLQSYSSSPLLPHGQYGGASGLGASWAWELRGWAAGARGDVRRESRWRVHGKRNAKGVGRLHIAVIAGATRIYKR